MMTNTPGVLLQRIRLLLFALVMLSASAASSAAVFVSVAIAPPPLPVYAQPIVPGPGYIWTPGYWAYGPDGYYWVPGTWVLAPFIGALWTPGYWGWGNGLYVWHAGYWGPHVGFYGGINYGFGYIGVGYQGGYWNNGAFYYNRAVNNVNVTNIHNTYNTTVVSNATVSRVSYNGGTGGISAQPTAAEQSAAREAHRSATAAQQRHEQLSSTNRSMLASVNQGRPSIAATPRAAAFGHPSAVAADGAVKRTRPAEGMRAQSAPPGGPVHGNMGGGHVNPHPDAAMQHPQGAHGDRHPDTAMQHPQGQPRGERRGGEAHAGEGQPRGEHRGEAHAGEGQHPR